MSHGFWLLTQHTDHSDGLQEMAVRLLKKAVREKQASSKDLAYLTDRILMNKGKKQLYGTQFKIVNKKIEPHPIQGRSKLAKRRKDMGLVSFADNKRDVEKRYANLLK